MRRLSWLLAPLLAAALVLVVPSLARADPGTDGQPSTIQDQMTATIKAYQDAQAIMWREGPTYWMYHSLDTVGVRKRVKNFTGRPDRMLDARNVTVEG